MKVVLIPALVLGVFSTLACNSILGIDAAQLDPSDASASGGGAGGASARDVACSLKATDPCNECIAQNCCGEYEACLGNPECRSKLVDYAFCLGKNFTNDAGVSCDENFVTTRAASDLAQCAFLSTCQGVCAKKTIGDLCFNYCGCMDSICEGGPFDGGMTSCEVACQGFTEEQLICRPYHCSLAAQNKDEPVMRKLHCGHASGFALCP